MARAPLGLALPLLACLATSAGAQFDSQQTLPTGGSTETDPFSERGVLRRDELIALVLERNPSVEAARLAWQAALERIPHQAALPDPTISYSLAPLSVGSSDAPFGHVARFGQHFPYPGIRRLRAELAEAEADAVRGRLNEVRHRLVTMASRRYDDLYLLERSREINQQHLELLTELHRIAIARYSAGLASQQDPLQAEVERTHLLHEEMVLEARHQLLVAQINALLHRSPLAELPPPVAMLPPPEPVDASIQRLLELAQARRPELDVVGAEVEAYTRLVELRKLDRKPGFEAAASYNSMWRLGEHRWTVGLGVTVPLYRKRLRAGVAEAEAHKAAAVRRRESLEDEVGAEVVAAAARLEEAMHTIELYRDRLLPASRDLVTAARAGFASGRDSFLTVIEAEKNQRTVELDHHRTLADAYTARADLARAVGETEWVSKGAFQ